MKLNSLITPLLLLSPLTQQSKVPTVEDAARYARTLIKRESLVNVNTIYNETGIPTSFVEYYADCGDGLPVLLIIDMSTSNRNLEKGSPVSLSTRVGDHPPTEKVDPKYPGSRPNSVAGSPRINLRGNFKTVSKEDDLLAYLQIEKCFLKRHRDASWWLPNNPIHSSHFVKFELESIYFIGGFGDTGYIGEIPVELYKSSKDIDGKDGDDDEGVDEDEESHPFGTFGKFFDKLSLEMDIFERIANGEALDLSFEELDLIKERFGDLNIKAIRDLTKEKANEILTQLEKIKDNSLRYGFDSLAQQAISLF